MREISNSSCHLISGGSGSYIEENCLVASLNFLNQCDMMHLYAVNEIFQKVLLSDEFKDADLATLKAALITAIENELY